MFYQARKKRDKNDLIPGLVLLAAGLVKAMIAMQVSGKQPLPVA